MKPAFAFLLTAALLTPAPALAANDGTLGTESTGDFEITYTVTDSPNIRISGFEHYDLDYRRGDPLPPMKGIDFCVFMDQPGTYSATIDLAPLTDTVTTYPYDFEFVGSGAGSIGTPRVERPITGLTSFPALTPSTVDDDCVTEGMSGMLKLELSEAPTIKTIQNATATIRVTVTPD